MGRRDEGNGGPQGGKKDRCEFDPTGRITAPGRHAEYPFKPAGTGTVLANDADQVGLPMRAKIAAQAVEQVARLDD
ncbi:hypothetical protein SAMN04489859_100279 [Paracoccus alcaliphilus]|uniref:Uncharacterized protein n=1 Tax=Paracoccus alcaliphilus TaxID=34002 RepID=A0A1H8EIY9_9RHOB|nr:hypothetical protein SAMN04489859_100279 [Paracoccus alcaliphilus]